MASVRYSVSVGVQRLKTAIPTEHRFTGRHGRWRPVRDWKADWLPKVVHLLLHGRDPSIDRSWKRRHQITKSDSAGELADWTVSEGNAPKTVQKPTSPAVSNLRKNPFSPLITTAYFTSQIEAAKIVQRAASAEWNAKRRATFPDAPDLKRDLRPKIDDIGRKLLGALGEFKRGERISSEELPQRSKKQLVGLGMTSEVRVFANRPFEDSSA